MAKCLWKTDVKKDTRKDLKKELKIIAEKSFGMLSQNKFSYEEIAKLTGISAEEVKEIEKEALVRD